MASFARGTLVEIDGLSQPAEPVAEASADAFALDLNGVRAQLIDFDKPSQKWRAAAFNGAMIAVDERYLRPLAWSELKHYDFVFGPASDMDTVGSELANVLRTKGYAVMKLFIGDDDEAEILATAKRLEDDEQFSRMPVEFERGYLGKDFQAKTLLLDPFSPSAPSFVKDSALQTMDQNFGAMCELLGDVRDALGFDISSRTGMVLQVPLVDGDEEKYVTADIDDGDAEAYMHTMWRKKITLLQFVGPSAGTVTLTPRGLESGDEVQLPAEPHTILLTVESRYEYCYQPAPGFSLALCTFMLEAPLTFRLGSMLTGSDDSVALTGTTGKGPEPPPGDHVIVDGMYCRYGAGADMRDKLWIGVAKAATDGVIDIPFSRWNHSTYYDPDADSFQGKAYTRHGCFGVEGVELFDNKFFDIAAAEAKTMDPCQRQVMEVSYMVLVEGGWEKRGLQRESQHIGHFVGIDKDDWMCMAVGGAIDTSGTIGATNANAIISNRFSYQMNLKGASMTIDTACSSSLVCTHVSKLHLRFKEFDAMPGSIVNGLNLMLFPGPYVACCSAGMLSCGGRCFTFDQKADGFARGEACGAAMFKPKPYRSDGRVYGVLAGSQANQDGRSASLTAPNGPAQEKCFRAVLKECVLTPTEVDCVECNGTGTQLGDPIEVGSCRKVMSVTPRTNPLVISSLKSSIAHAEGGSGLCGLFKCLMQVAHCEAAPTLHCRERNSHIILEDFECLILPECLRVRGYKGENKDGDSSYSGVSSFGIGGTNAHAEVWGMDIYTELGNVKQDADSVFLRKLQAAPPAEITMNGDDVKDWDTNGLDPRAEPHSMWKISLDADGSVAFEKDDDDSPDYGGEFFIQGTFTDKDKDGTWIPDPLDADPDVPGLWTGEVELDQDGEDYFQIVADNDASKIYYPGIPECTDKARKILYTGDSELVRGKDSEPPGQEYAWCIRGMPYEKIRVDFYQSNGFRSINWYKAKAGPS